MAGCLSDWWMKKIAMNIDYSCHIPILLFRLLVLVIGFQAVNVEEGHWNGVRFLVAYLF